MTPDELSRAIKRKLHPEPYDREVQPAGPFDFVIVRRSALPGGRYAFAFQRLDTAPIAETFERARTEARRLTRSLWLFREVGAYLMFCGPERAWRDQTMHAVADRTGLHSIIIQAVHFVDPETGAQHLDQSSWGPVRFGGLVPIPELVQEAIRNAPGQRIPPHDDQRA